MLLPMKRLDAIINELKEIDEDLNNVIALGSEVKGIEGNLKKFLYN